MNSAASSAGALQASSTALQASPHDIVSLRALDGKASIEHQISIHVQDLFDIRANPEVGLEEVLGGLRYLMDFRIRKGRMPTLDLDVMRRLAEALMLHMSGSKGLAGTTRRRAPSIDDGNMSDQAATNVAAVVKYRFRGKKLSRESNECFFLFVEFLEEVEEFRQAVAQKPVADLRHALRLHTRCAKYSSLYQLQLAEACVRAVQVLTSMCPQFADWHDLTLEEGYDDMEKALEELKDKVVAPTNALIMGKAGLFPPPGLYFDRDITKIIPMFRTNAETGLSSTSIPDFVQHYGLNALPTPPKPSILKMLLAQVVDLMVVILIIAIIVQFALKEYKPGGVLVIVVFVNIVIGFWQELKANKALDALNNLTVARARVIRDGQVQEVDATVLVPGDIVVLEEGDAVPADLRIVEAAQLEIIESILTGESVGVLKLPNAIRSNSRRMALGDCKGNAFMSTLVARGRGKGLVVRTGSNTEIGKISSAITSTPHVQTPIQRKLSKLGLMLVALAFILCALVLIIGVAWGNNVLSMVMVSISLAVSVIPEGLVVVVTVTMARGVSRMAQRQVIVRKLPSVETLGSVTVVCSDKTGTLTEGKMGAAAMWTVDDQHYSFTESTSLDPEKGRLILQEGTEHNVEISRTAHEAPALTVLAMAVAGLCNNADVIREVSVDKTATTTITTSRDDDIESKSKDTHTNTEVIWKPIGDPTEVAMVVASQKSGFSKCWWEKTSSYGMRKLGENAFDSDRKVMSVVYSSTVQGGDVDTKSKYYLLAKGAPEAVLSRCSGQLSTSGAHANPLSTASEYVALDKKLAGHITERSSEMARGGLRVLGLAMRQLDSKPDVNDAKQLAALEKDLHFVGLIGLIDPPRKGVQESITICKDAGIKVIMITGDHIATAAAIATQLGILEPGNPEASRAIRGAELDMLSDEQIASLRPFPCVFARVSPDNKLKIVKALQSTGNSVAMTGDGVNDAPAIKAADVGVAMGIGGTEITKQAADIVLANDDFTTIVAAIEEGRRVFDNIQKFIVYLLSCNSAEIWLMLLCTIINKDVPFTTMVILWANIIADIPPAMAIGIEPPELDIMCRKPRDPKASVVDRFIIIIIFAQAWSMTLISFTAYMLSSGSARVSSDNIIPDQLNHARSLTFAILTTIQLFQGFLSRSTTQSIFRVGLLGNKWMVGAVLFSFLCLLLGFYIPQLAHELELVYLPAIDWAWVLLSLVAHVAISEVVKLAYRARIRRQGRNTFQPIEGSSISGSRDAIHP